MLNSLYSMLGVIYMTETTALPLYVDVDVDVVRGGTHTDVSNTKVNLLQRALLTICMRQD